MPGKFQPAPPNEQPLIDSRTGQLTQPWYRWFQLFPPFLTSPAASVAPASATAQGIAGQIAFDASFVYVCIATNTWKRAALSTW